MKRFVSLLIICALALQNLSYGEADAPLEASRPPRHIKKLDRPKHNTSLWVRYATAAGAVVAATVAMVLVAHHHDHKVHERHHRAHDHPRRDRDDFDND